jgi:hypothetical protein
MDVHLTKLKEIKGRKNIVHSNSPCPQSKTSKKYVDDRNLHVEKKVSLYKENRAMFGRLLHISQNNSKVFDRSFTYNRNSFRSSYEISRKNQEKKIAVENELIVKKLTEIKPVLQKKTLDQEYTEYKKRKKRLLKLSSFAVSFDSEKSGIRSSPKLLND